MGRDLSLSARQFSSISSWDAGTGRSTRYSLADRRGLILLPYHRRRKAAQILNSNRGCCLVTSDIVFYVFSVYTILPPVVHKVS